MNEKLRNFTRNGNRVLRHTLLFVLAISLGAGALTLGANYLAAQQEKLVAASTDNSNDWGVEALDTLQQQAEKLSPIALANACGLGASSCFRCHNGQRAQSPKTGDDGPWHTQHAKVNYSCAGCHKGNPRIIKESIAHKDLVVNPVAAPDKTCASCHAADAKDKAQTYLKTHPQLTRGE